MRNLAIVFLLTYAVGLTSCLSSKKVVYAVDLEEAVTDLPKTALDHTHRIEIGDLLQVTISAKDKMRAMDYNLPASNAGGTLVFQGRGQGIIVDSSGYIALPKLGSILVKGKTANEISLEIKEMVGKELLEPFVQIAVLNFRITVMGSVKAPGVFSSAVDRLTILEALALGGDILPTAKLNDVWVIRENAGKRTYHKLNLNSKEFFNSEFYYLKNNDVIYVQPDKFSAYYQNNGPIFGLIGTATGVIGFLIAILSR